MRSPSVDASSVGRHVADNGTYTRNRHVTSLFATFSSIFTVGRITHVVIVMRDHLVSYAAEKKSSSVAVLRYLICAYLQGGPEMAQFFCTP